MFTNEEKMQKEQTFSEAAAHSSAAIPAAPEPLGDYGRHHRELTGWWLMVVLQQPGFLAAAEQLARTIKTE